MTLISQAVKVATLIIAFIAATAMSSSAGGSMETAAGHCGLCVEYYWATFDHNFPSQNCTSETGNYEADPNPCHGQYATGLCDPYHFNCNAQDDSLNLSELEAAVLANSPDAVIAIMQGHEKVSYNADRRALQVLDCDGHVWAQFPVSQDIQTSLTTANTKASGNR
jgi:hypothetical protein